MVIVKIIIIIYYIIVYIIDLYLCSSEHIIRSLLVSEQCTVKQAFVTFVTMHVCSLLFFLYTRIRYLYVKVKII